jgi:predicted enzyme related to lactoylglutathione lyase
MNLLSAMVGGLAILAAQGAAATAAIAAPAPVVFFDIAGPELAKQAAFYRAVFDWNIGADGGFAAPVTSPLHATLRVEPPTQGPVTERVIYVGVSDVTAALAKIVAHGGAVVFPRTEVPGVVVLALFTDPAGNRMGLVEMDGDKPKVPKAP